LLEGTNPYSEGSLELNQAAVDLGSFVSALQKSNLPGGPFCNRGQPLATQEEEIRASIALLNGIYDTALLTEIWENSLAASIWKGEPKWIHCDLHAGNLLAVDGRITAVLDFGSSGVGDPAVDLIPAWTLFTSDTRKLFRSIISPDDAMWSRGRGWALYAGVGFPYYQDTNPVLAASGRRTLDAVIAEYKEIQ
jgi:aminoglycoside phosphotransferase (APT) family kinase protein